jgi:hypothetical protein
MTCLVNGFVGTGLVCSLLFMGTFGACKTQPSPVLSTRSDVVVELPPTPDLSEQPWVRAYGDGPLTVEGVVRERSQWLGKEVDVRGVVRGLLLCAEEDGRTPRRCVPRQHGFLTDADGSDEGRRLLLTGTMESVLADLKEGELATVRGRLDVVSTDGAFVRQEGLLVLADKEPTVP